MKILKDIKNIINIYFIYVNNDIKSQLSYTIDFWSQMILWFIYSLIPFLGVSILFKKFNSIGSWTIYHIGILYGIVGLSYDTARMIGRGFDNFHKLIITGDLDIFYIRPQPIIIQILGNNFFLRRLAGLAQYLLILSISLTSIYRNLSVKLHILLFVFLLTYIGTFLVFMSLLLIYSTICFFTIDKNLFSDVFIDTTAEIAYYPIEYLNKFIKTIFKFFIPIIWTTYIPIKHVLFLKSYDSINYAIIIMPIVIGTVSLIVSKKIFSYSLKYYSSVNN